MRLGNVPYAQTAFNALDRAPEKFNIAVEGCFGPREDRPGRAYLAVPCDLGVEEVLRLLEAERLPVRLTLIHPD